MAFALAGFCPAARTTREIALVGDTAFLATAEFGLVVVDVQNPTDPQVLGAPLTPFDALVVAANATATLAITGSNVAAKLLDTTTLGAPVVVATLTAQILAVAISGTRAYIARVVPGNPASITLQIYNVATPASPVLLGALPVTLTRSSIRVSGTTVYLPVPSGLQVVDCADPANPRSLGILPTTGMTPQAVEIENDRLYLSATSAVLIYSIVDAKNPALLSTIATAVTGRMAVSRRTDGRGTWLYVVNSPNIKAIDVSDSWEPLVAGNFTAREGFALAATPWTLFLGSQSATQSVRGLYCLDLTDEPSGDPDPTVARALIGGYDDFGVGVTSGGIALVAGNANGLNIADVSTPADPTALRRVNGTWRGAAAEGNYGYAIEIVAGNPPTPTLRVYNLATPIPSIPPLMASLVLPTGAMALAGLGTGFLVAACGLDGIRVIDITTPAAPAIVGTLSTVVAYGISLATNKCYVAGANSIWVVNTTTLASPAILGTLAVTQATACSIGSGSKLYVVAGVPCRLKIIDVTTAASPSLVSSSEGYAAAGVWAIGTKAYLATSAISHLGNVFQGGVRMVDCVVPATPAAAVLVEVPGTCRTLLAVSTTLYCGDSAALVDVLTT